MTIISGANTEMTFSLPSSNQSLVVTSTGSIVDDNGDDDIVSAGSNNQITIYGFVYSVAAGETTGIKAIGSNTAINVDGTVQAEIGIGLDNAVSSSITVGTQGTVKGLFDAIEFVGAGSTTASAYRLSNAGNLTATGSGDDAVLFTQGGDDSLTNSGQISGAFAVLFYKDFFTENLENSGTITGGSSARSSAIRSDSSTAGLDIINSGLITDGAANALGSSYSLIWFDDAVGVTSTIDNQGTVTGAGYVIQSLSDILDISNSGSIHGGLYSQASVSVHNSGHWAGQAASAVTVFDLMTGGDALTNTRAGTIDGGLTLASGGDTITNAGAIDGAITFTGTGATNSLMNSGEITGNITFSGPKSTFTDTGTVTGNVKLGATNMFVNHGQIYGDVTAGSANTLTNKGIIHGDVTLGAHDTIYVGDVTGVVNAKTSDLLEFSGNFGNQTINKFLAGGGSTADVIQFAANDFSSFAQVQGASTQQGSDVVIRLDATDSITLTGVTLSSLVAANYAFV